MQPRKKTSVTIHATTPAGKELSKTVVFVADACRLFYNAQHLLLQLERGERAWYDFLCEQMDSGNRVTVDKALRQQFTTFVANVTSSSTTYSESSVTQYTTKLARLGLILKEGGGNSGYYLVNPKYAFAGTEAARKSLLQILIEEKIYAGESIQHLINEPEGTFMSS